MPSDLRRPPVSEEPFTSTAVPITPHKDGTSWCAVPAFAGSWTVGAFKDKQDKSIWDVEFGGLEAAAAAAAAAAVAAAAVVALLCF